MSSKAISSTATNGKDPTERGQNPGIERHMEYLIDYHGYGYPSRYGSVFRSFGLEGKFYFFGDENVVYDPKEDKWSPLRVDVRMGDVANPNRNDTTTFCVIDNVLFFYDDGVFKWYDLKVSLWKELKGLEVLSDINKRGLVKMVDSGGKMTVLWFEYRYFSDDDDLGQGYQIWFAEISLERRGGDEIWGKVEWFDDVANGIVPDHCDLSRVDVLSAIV